MTHPQRLLLTSIFATVLVACTDNRPLSEADLSAFGTYVYRLDTLQLQQTLQELLATDTSQWRADQTVRQHYASAARYEDTPLWFTRMGVSPDADSLLAQLRRRLPLDGLDTAAFFVPQIARDLDIVHKLAFDSLGVSINELLPRLDYRLSQVYVRYTTGQRYGFLRPAKLLNQLDYKIGSSDYARLFDFDTQAPDYDEALRQLTDDKHRMNYLGASRPAAAAYDALSQRLAQTTIPEERKTLAVNIERCRWQMPQPPAQGRRILVNLAAQQLWAIGPDSVMTMRICCGSNLTKTPLLHSNITHMQVNPDWIIPQNIIKNEVTHHAGDSAYFARHRYYIVERATGDTLNAKHVTAAQMQSGRLRIGQHGGPGNSLGRIVFRFANNFAIYLHDTNNPSAFSRERRTLSHGCIRVQRPFDLAQFLLPEADEWTLDRLRLSMDLKPETERGRQYLKDLATRKREDPSFTPERPLRLITYHDVAPPVPVYITYFTAYPNPATDSVEIYPDLYGYDKIIARELPLPSVASSPKPTSSD